MILIRRFAVKNEIRSLGIDLCKPERVIGAVARGGFYLDGLVMFSPRQNHWNASIAHDIVRSRFYPELKLIMTHDPAQRLDLRKIEKLTGLPAIEVRIATQERRPGMRQFRFGRKMLQVRSSLDTKIVREVLGKTWMIGELPESLRVAHLIAKSGFHGRRSSFSG